jgi:hypothetical protein
MHIPVFFSYPKPFLAEQAAFIETLAAYLRERGLDPRTLGVSDYDMDAPLAGIRRLMVQTCGLVAVALRRSLAPTLQIRPSSDIAGMDTASKSNVWFTSPYAHIEPAMAYQFGLPVLIIREEGVVIEGVLEPGVTGLQSLSFDLTPGQPDLKRPEWSDRLYQWESKVRRVHDKRGEPPSLY